ncbi:hypothetical protein CY34DRAFT_404737 [Suillus luteus UH-Slu-Lm8-n1]|uniref:DUF7702 domain-containing protein n=1 Tax=Suillus luteus UH-Slu-Lm8-n1 TaxID=930992 RepID=A0A0D0A921_9AGAM|nr:hypothetical protein CY34DRAFT_404737 [Suillus luteus UH-Slu-Lm8-n1]
MSLNTQGILAAVSIAMYAPFLFISIKLVAKYGILRGDGWAMLLVFCILRVLGCCLLVAADETTPVNTSLYVGGYCLQASGLCPLLLCTLGLLHSVFQTPEGVMRYKIIFRLLQAFGTAAVILMGMSYASSDSSSSSSNIMRRTGVIVLAILYIIVVGICIFLWTQIRFVMKYRKQLLKVISVALPFLAIRTVYSVLTMFSTSSYVMITTATTAATIQPNTGDLAKFNIFTGEWQIYLVMYMFMEYAIVIIYSVASFVLPLNEDHKNAMAEMRSSDSISDRVSMSSIIPS